MTTTATTGAKLTWTKTALGVSFAAYWVFRLHPSGWLPIAKLLDENKQTWTDTEAARNVVESYRMYVEDTLGGVSQFTGTVAVTVPGSLMVISSNTDPTINQELSMRYPIDVAVPENSRLVAASGRYGQRLIRQSTKIGETFEPTVFKRRSNTAGGIRGPAQWESLINSMREDLPYIALLTPMGDRKLVGATVDTIRWLCNAEDDIPVKFPEVGNTPAVVTIT